MPDPQPAKGTPGAADPQAAGTPAAEWGQGDRSEHPEAAAAGTSCGAAPACGPLRRSVRGVTRGLTQWPVEMPAGSCRSDPGAQRSSRVAAAGVWPEAKPEGRAHRWGGPGTAQEDDGSLGLTSTVVSREHGPVKVPDTPRTGLTPPYCGGADMLGAAACKIISAGAPNQA
mmetsp:Transcript_104855/g.296722  ORF Transcript_104855/g.296722 Transcript_104855/m.296722 type:complete len:171 (-) Transcript_104855:54-566(-)